MSKDVIKIAITPAGTQGSIKAALPRVEIYTLLTCGYCMSAKYLLNRRGVSYVEYDLSTDQSYRKEMILRASGKTTVPQIFINDEHIGGSDELALLDHNGALDEKLGRKTTTSALAAA